MIRLEMRNYNRILTEKLQKISVLSSEVIDKYKYLNGEEILPSNQWQMIKQAKLAYSPLEKNFKKQTEKQIGALNLLNPSNKKDKIKIFAKSVEWFRVISS